MNGYYINLDTRIDRKKDICKIQKEYPFFKNITRMKAIFNNVGSVGCGLSHIKCLTELQKRNDDYYLIMEDDFYIFDYDKFDCFIKDFNEIKDDTNWDIIILTPRGDTVKRNFIKNFHKINNHQTATAYIVRHTFIESLLSILKSSIIKLMNNGSPNLWANDQCWKPLQLKSNFIYYHEIFAGQKPGYSDIEKKYVDYNQQFLEQYIK